MSIENLPVGTNVFAFSRARTDRGIEYSFESRDGGWNLVLKGKTLPGAKYYLNDRPVAFTSAGIRMSGRKNHVRVIP
jgi:hypothetical protein